MASTRNTCKACVVLALIDFSGHVDKTDCTVVESPVMTANSNAARSAEDTATVLGSEAMTCLITAPSCMLRRRDGIRVRGNSLIGSHGRFLEVLDVGKSLLITLRRE
jgi:hypothetical protein